MDNSARIRTHSGTALCRAALKRKVALRIPIVAAAILPALGVLLGSTGLIAPLPSYSIFLIGLTASIVLIAVDRLILKPLHKTLDTISGLHRRREGELTSQIGHLLDIIGRQERNVALLTESIKSEQKSRDELARSLESKSELLAEMSHEIRTPMNGIIGMTILALETELNSEQRDYLETVKQSADSLLTIINDILDSSKIEAGKLTIHSEQFRLRPLLKRTVALLSLRAKEKGVNVIQNIAEDIPDCLIGDETRIGQILINLIGNAIKFTPENGSIFLHLLQESMTKSHIILHLSVTDTGIGIADDKLDQIFEPFTQADNDTSKRFGGTGLGLSISRQLVELMGGRIWVESIPEVGSAFHVILRLEISQHELKSLPAKVTTIVRSSTHDHKRNILLVEDNKVNQKLALRLLERKGFSVTLATNGKEALELITAPNKAQKFDLVFMDCHMPIMDGYEATKLIRSHESSSEQRLPIVAMTALSMSGDREKCLAAGMDDYLAKPFEISELNQILDQWLRLSQQPDHTQQNP